MLIQNNFRITKKLNKPLVTVLILLLCLTISVSELWAQESQIILATKDNTLIESSTGEFSNGMGSSFFVGRTNQNFDSIRRGLIAFDIADQIPAGSTITEVKLTLNLERTPSDNESVELHRVLADWGEGSSNSRGGRGAIATKGDATWVHTFYDTDIWSDSGGNFASDPSAVQTIGDVGIYTWGSTPGMVQDVQQWLDSPETNFGWLLLGNEADSGTVKVFASRHNTDSSMQPQLSVNFQP